MATNESSKTVFLAMTVNFSIGIAKSIKDLPKSTTFIRVTQTTNEIYTGSENN